MRIGVFGTGAVGRTIGTALVARGHEVMLGSRAAGNETAAAWRADTGERAEAGTFADAAAFGSLVFNCTRGDGSLAAVESAAGALADKVLVDVSNPLDFSQGMPPTLFVSGTDSLGEQIQRALPRTRVVKALNTVSHLVMIRPERLDGPHDLFICGDDVDAKAMVAARLRDDFGWRSIVDLGDITAARATEAYVLFWVRCWGTLQDPLFNVRIVKA